MAQREWGRNIGAYGKQTEQGTYTGRKLTEEITQVFVATTEKERHTRIERTVIRK